MLIQAEAGVASVTGGPEAPARVGVSVCDIGAGMNAYEAVLEALIARGRTGEGAAISVSMFDGMADWMTTPLLQHEGGVPPKRIGLAHTSISPYGVFKSRDGADILISIQSDREWRVLAEKVLGDKALAADPNFATNIERVKRRAETDGKVAAAFGALDVDALVEKLAAADIAFGRVNGPAELARHPHLRRIDVGSPGGPLSYPAPAAQWAGEARTLRPGAGASASTAKRSGRSSSGRGRGHPSRRTRFASAPQDEDGMRCSRSKSGPHGEERSAGPRLGPWAAGTAFNPSRGLRPGRRCHSSPATSRSPAPAAAPPASAPSAA